MQRDSPQLMRGIALQKRLIQFHLRCVLTQRSARKQIIDLPQEQRGEAHSLGILSEKWCVFCQQKASSSTSAWFINCSKTYLVSTLFLTNPLCIHTPCVCACVSACKRVARVPEKAHDWIYWCSCLCLHDRLAGWPVKSTTLLRQCRLPRS